MHGRIDGAVAALQTLLRQLRQIVVAGSVASRDRKIRHIGFPELELDVALVGNFEGPLQRVGQIRKQRLHLFGTLHVESVGIAQAIFLVNRLAGLNADQGVVGVVVGGAEKVEVVGGHQRHSQLAVQLEQAVVYLGFGVNVVALDLQVVVVAENVHKLAGDLFSCG